MKGEFELREGYGTYGNYLKLPIPVSNNDIDQIIIQITYTKIAILKTQFST